MLRAAGGRAAVKSAQWAGLVSAAALGMAVAAAPLSWAAAFVCSVAVGLVLLRWTPLALPLLAFAVPFGSLWEVGLGVVSVGATEGILAAALFLWAGSLAVDRRAPRTPPLAIPLLVFWSIQALSVVVSADLALSMKGLLIWFEVVLTYWMAYDLMDLGRARLLAGGMVLAAGLEAGLGTVQYLSGAGPEGFALPGGFSRASGTFGQPNPFGGYLAMTLPVAVALGFGPVHRWSRWLRGLALVAAGLIGGGILASWSRGAWLGAGAGSIALVAGGVKARRIRGRRGLAVGASAAGVAGMAIVWMGAPLRAMVSRLAELIPYIGVNDVRYLTVTDQNFALVDRLAHWQAAVAMVSDSPILGVGIGNYPAAYPRFAAPGWPDALGHAHNYYLNIAAEAGLLGLAAYLALWAGIALLAWGALRCARQGWRPIAIGASAALVAWAIHSGFDNLLVHGLNLQFALLMSLLAASAQGSDV